MVKRSAIPEEFQARIMVGRAAAKKIREKLRQLVAQERAAGRRAPKLVVIQVGEDEASKIYIRQKQKAATKIGIEFERVGLGQNTPEHMLLGKIERFNTDPGVDGVLVQLPLPEHIDETKVIEAIAPEKDVDGFHPVNQGKLFTGAEGALLPCTPQGCMYLLKEAGVTFKGRKAVVVGRSNIVGKPLAMLLMAEHATLTICHSRTRDLPAEVARADILVACVGKPEMIQGEWIKEGAAVVDVGISRLSDGSLVGDVEFGSALRRAAHITPVPGGVGPMTVASLMQNVVRTYQRRYDRR